MAITLLDHASIDARHKFIKEIIEQVFGREVSSIARLGRDSNNYAHLISLTEASASIEHVTSLLKPGTKPLPQSAQKIVVRISNPDAMLNNAVRVENEVAAMTLMRDALQFPVRIVPEVYAWNTAAEGPGWIVQEYMRGESLGDRFSKLSDIQLEHVLDQVAQIFKAIQNYTPDVTGFGGLNFNKEGKVVTGELTIWFDGPFTTYLDMYLGIFRKQLELSQTTALVDGWRGTDLGERLKSLDQTGGFARLLSETSNVRPTLVHGDFSLENILFDPETLQVTALLDYDFTHIASTADEFFYSFMDFHGLVPGPSEDPQMESLRLAQLNGFSDTNLGKIAGIDWKLAKMWQAAMKRAHVKTPVDIEDIGELATIYWFLLDVCPPYFLLPRWLKKRTEQQRLAIKRTIERNLDKYLKQWGF